MVIFSWAGSAKTKLTSLDVSRNCLGRQGAAALAAGLDEGSQKRFETQLFGPLATNIWKHVDFVN